MFFYFVFFIAKIPRFISKQKNQSSEKNLGQVHSGLFLCIFLVLFLFGFFVVPSPTVQKLEENQKKKNNPVRRILGKSIQDCFFWFFWFIWFFSRFLLSQAQLSKNSRKTKTKNQKKNNPVRRILGKSIQDWFFWFIWFFSRFLLSQAQLSKNSRKTKKKQKKQSCEKNLGQVHSGLFLCIFLFLFGFFVVPSPTVQKLEENKKKQKKQSCEKNLG